MFTHFANKCKLELVKCQWMLGQMTPIIEWSDFNAQVKSCLNSSNFLKKEIINSSAKKSAASAAQ